MPLCLQYCVSVVYYSTYQSYEILDIVKRICESKNKTRGVIEEENGNCRHSMRPIDMRKQGSIPILDRENEFTGFTGIHLILMHIVDAKKLPSQESFCYMNNVLCFR